MTENKLKEWTTAQKELNYKKFVNQPLGQQFIRLATQGGFPEDDLKEVVWSRGKNDLFAMVLSVLNMNDEDRKDLIGQLVEDTKKATALVETEDLKAEVKKETEEKPKK